ncbi:Orf255 (mitochondrion) [Monosiga brevicollis]|uniref:Orf255 n=1 Tax=Monosiga brevicollis TaxID=81824 RepID=Q8HIS3_MONBE|nr:Orf255 [Monosiga brevicollis]AAN28361.1 Orf255 [Monosiga brevicollis]|eukprot:NP_696990.1 Orf255 (mitochondrion) [Monosiga brevicollis ATCC 50154]
MSNIGKQKILIPKQILDPITELKGYNKETFEIVNKEILNNQNPNLDKLNKWQFIRKVDIDGKIVNYTQEIIMLNELSNKISINETSNNWELSILLENNINKEMKSYWGLIKSKLNQIIDNLYIIKNINNDKINEDLIWHKNPSNTFIYKNAYKVYIPVGKGIGYRITDISNNQNKMLELSLGSTPKKLIVPNNIDYNLKNINELILYPKYHFNMDNNTFNSASLNELSLFANNIKNLKSGLKDKYKGIGLYLEKL